MRQGAIGIAARHLWQGRDLPYGAVNVHTIRLRRKLRLPPKASSCGRHWAAVPAVCASLARQDRRRFGSVFVNLSCSEPARFWLLFVSRRPVAVIHHGKTLECLERTRVQLRVSSEEKQQNQRLSSIFACTKGVHGEFIDHAAIGVWYNPRQCLCQR